MRPDLTENRIRFVRGDSDEEVYGKLRQILYEQRLRGGTGFIKGGRLREQARKDWVLGVGIVVPKEWLFQCEGRPVLYQTDEEICRQATNGVMSSSTHRARVENTDR